MLEGKQDLKVSKEIGDGWIVVGSKSNAEFIRKSEIPRYVDEEFWRWYWIWHRYYLGMGFPFAGGWAEQPAVYAEVIELFEVLRKNWEAERGARQVESHNTGRSR